MDYVSIILRDSSGRYLLQLRDLKEGVIYPGHWGFFGGSIENNENQERAAIRELKEELNLVADRKRLKILFECESMAGKGVIFLYEFSIDPDNLVLNEGESMALFELNELKKLDRITPELKKYIQSLI